ncbi:hypothetical protein [Granulicella paludicola]|uniref:hypothetical protein n=1 Tax=Granulicella paludicola TaxID=474951 RepID=UPI0021DF57EE|nr:hypothetical protein [Granulicella paludicola]
MKLGVRFAMKSSFVLASFSIATLLIPSRAAAAQQVATASAPSAKPVIEEWVYRTKYGYKDEWWALFKEYQIAILERQK